MSLCRTWLIAAVCAGCGSYQTTHQVELPSDGIWSVYADDDRGDVSYDGTAPDEIFTITTTSWAKARTRGRAARRAESNDFGALISGELLDVWGRSGVERAGVDLAVVGPRVMDVEALTNRGTVALYEVDGFHYVTGSRVVGRGVYGDIDAYADGEGIDLEVFPYEGSVIRLESVGNDLVVALPAGLPYDLDLAADPDWGYDLTDLGFDDIVLGRGYALASAGAGTVRVQLIASGGTIVVLEAY